MIMENLNAVAVAKLCTALSVDSRVKIVQFLATGIEPTQSEICEKLSISPSLLSHHLAALMNAGVVTVRKDGLFRRTSLRPDSLELLRALADGACQPA
jgi:DNA-binding transcriptional ArsR family regulator